MRAVLAGTLWAAVESIAEREPRPSTAGAIREYAPLVEPVHGAEFEGGRARGRILSLEEAVEHLLANLD